MSSAPTTARDGASEAEQHRPVAVVTGASAGVGRAVTRELAARGFDVAVIARGEAGLRAAADEVEERGGRALLLPCDVADWDSVSAAAERCERELGPIELWCNVAMTTVFGRVWDCTPDEIRRATEVTYLGQVHGTLAALQHLRPRNRGRIVNVGSALAYVGIPLQSAYCGAKFAVRGFSESVRAELLAEASAVTLAQVHLPAVNTPQFGWCLSRMARKPQPVAPIYQPELAARAVVDCALGTAPTRVLGSWNRLIVRGVGVVPEILARYAARTAVDGQQTDEPATAGRPSNLWHPTDQADDHGAHGAFDRRANGVLDPTFLRGIPRLVGELAAATAATARNRVGRLAGAIAGLAARSGPDVRTAAEVSPNHG